MICWSVLSDIQQLHHSCFEYECVSCSSILFSPFYRLTLSFTDTESWSQNVFQWMMSPSNVKLGNFDSCTINGGRIRSSLSVGWGGLTLWSCRKCQIANVEYMVDSMSSLPISLAMSSSYRTERCLLQSDNSWHCISSECSIEVSVLKTAPSIQPKPACTRKGFQVNVLRWSEVKSDNMCGSRYNYRLSPPAPTSSHCTLLIQCRRLGDVQRGSHEGIPLAQDPGMSICPPPPAVCTSYRLWCRPSRLCTALGQVEDL